MNPSSFIKRYYVLPFTAAIVLILSICSVPSSAQHHPAIKDTTAPRNKEHKIKDIDEAIEELNKGITELNSEISKTDWNKMQQEINESMKKIDMEKVKAEADKAIKEIDVEKMKASAEEAIANVDWDGIKASLEKVKDIQLPKMETQLKEIKPQIEKAMQEARQGVEKAKVEMNAYKSFIDQLDADGLISKKGDYKIQIRKDEFSINGKTQPADVYNKYRSFLEEHQNVIIKKDKDGFDIKHTEK